MFRQFVIAAMMIVLPATVSASEAVITVTGQGQVAAQPDMATITLGVTARAPDAVDAMSEISTGVRAIFAELESAGIEERDIQTSGLWLNAVWASSSSLNGAGRVDGFEGGNTVTIRVRDLDALGQLLDALLRAGANRFQGLNFGVQEQQPLTDAARQMAVADARRKAELLSTAAGVTLGPVLKINEGGQQGGGQFMAAEMRTTAMPVAAGEVTTGASVTITWQLLTE